MIKRKQKGEWFPRMGKGVREESDTSRECSARQPGGSPRAPVGPEVRDRQSGKSRTGRAMGRKRPSWKINRQQRRKAI